MKKISQRTTQRRAFAAVLALGLWLPGSAPADEIPSGVVWTHKEENNWVHIYKNPSYDTTSTANRSVLVLGYRSSEEVVNEQCKYVNPATGKPYDVVIGLAMPTETTEAARVFEKDHFNADENAGAVGAAIEKAFGGKIQAATVDMHSNGNAVGITMLEKNIGFTGVTKLSMMAPDEGFGGRYLDPDKLSAMVGRQGIHSIDLYVNSGDLVPKAGKMTKEIEDVMALENISAKGVPLRPHYFDYDIHLSIGDHYLAAYLVLRALESGDPTVIENMRASVTEDVFQQVVSAVKLTGKFGAQVAKTIDGLYARLNIQRGLMGEAKHNLDEIQNYRAALSPTDNAALLEAANQFVSDAQKTVEQLQARIDLIERALACYSRIPPIPGTVPST
jgi:hypothetical protein